MSSEPSFDELSVLALRVELIRRGLRASGLKRSLQSRLKASFAVTGYSISVPRRFAPAEERVARSINGDDNDGLVSNLQTHEKSGLTERATKRTRIEVVGYWMGRSVWVVGADEMGALWTMADAYGKGSLSRSAPTYTTATDASATKGKAARQLIALEKFATKTTGLQASREGVEHLQLTLFEAYHATFLARRMTLATCEGKPLRDAAHVWSLFSAHTKKFAARFAAYSRYRATGWMPRSGLKYGVDWVLYPLGVEKHSHAPYCVILSHPTNTRAPSNIERTWIRLQNKLRLVKNVAKSLIVAEVWFDNGIEPSSWQDANKRVRISEITVDRWVP